MIISNDNITFEELVESIQHNAQIALDDPYEFKRPVKNVAIIGAGSNGLCSARHLKDAGLNVKIFERYDSVGGLWIYDEKIPPKPSVPTKFHSPPNTDNIPEKGESVSYRIDKITQTLLEKKPPTPCYNDLITNIPSKHFSYPDFPFPPDASVFPGHAEMLAYFRSYADYHNLVPLVTFNTCVEKTSKVGDEWELVLCRYEATIKGLKETRWKERFDAVVAASGLRQEPFIPDIDGITEYDAKWPEKIIHSKQFRHPEYFLNKNVVIVGASVSGTDMSRYMNKFAKSITVVNRGAWHHPIPVINDMRRKIPKHAVIKPVIKSFRNADGEVDGTIMFEDGTTVTDIDTIIFCTGYRHSLDYMEQKKGNLKNVPPSHVVLGREYALNSYHEVFLISDPTFCFIGMSHLFSTTPLFHTQAIAIARVFSGNAKLPTCENMAKLESEFNPGMLPDLYKCDRRRREIYVSFLNYQAKKLNLDLPLVTNFDDDYEEEGKVRYTVWTDLTDANFQKIEEKNTAVLLSKN